MLTKTDQLAIAELSPWASVAAAVLAALSRTSTPETFDEHTLCRAASLPGTQAIILVNLLRSMEKLGLVHAMSELQWRRVANEGLLRHLQDLLAAVAFYKESGHRDRTSADIVLTRPGEPSALESVLQEMGFASGLMEVTSEAFGDLAVSATRSFTVMTPFLDAHGGRWLAGLLRRTRSEVRKTVILRYAADPAHGSHPTGLRALRESLADVPFEVLDYLIVKPAGGYETFHAKVILSDDAYAYVGSANMNRASLEYSMELGVLLRGEAARRVGQVIEAIKRVARVHAAATAGRTAERR